MDVILKLRPAQVVVRHAQALLRAAQSGPILDVACGDGRNGLYLAALGARCLLVDLSAEALARAACNRQEVGRALGRPLECRLVRLNLETVPPPTFAKASLGAVLVVRYLYRPLVAVLQEALRPGGMFVYETYLKGQEVYGRPRNPAHLLDKGELESWFAGWEVLESFEGRLTDPPAAVGRLVCRKP